MAYENIKAVLKKHNYVFKSPDQNSVTAPGRTIDKKLTGIANDLKGTKNISIPSIHTINPVPLDVPNYAPTAQDYDKKYQDTIQKMNQLRDENKKIEERLRVGAISFETDALESYINQHEANEKKILSLQEEAKQARSYADRIKKKDEEHKASTKKLSDTRPVPQINAPGYEKYDSLIQELYNKEGNITEEDAKKVDDSIKELNALAIRSDVTKAKVALQYRDALEEIPLPGFFNRVGDAVKNITYGMVGSAEQAGKMLLTPREINGDSWHAEAKPVTENESMRRSQVYGENVSYGIDNPVAKFGIDAALSTANYGGNLLLAGGNPTVALALMGTQSGAQTAYEIGQEGGSYEQQLLGGIVAGGLEVLTEKLPLDEIMKAWKTTGKNGLTRFLKAYVKGAIPEAGEEFVNTIANNAAQSVIMNDGQIGNADFWANTLGEALYSAAAGAVTGGTLAGVPTIFNSGRGNGSPTNNGVQTRDVVDVPDNAYVRTAGENRAANHINPGERQSVRSLFDTMPTEDYSIPRVELPSNIFTDENGAALPVSKYPSAIRKYMTQKFKGKVLNIGQDGKVYISRDGIKEFSFPVKRLDQQSKNAKFAAGANLDSVLGPAVFLTNLSDDGGHPEATGGWDNYYVMFDTEYGLYSGIVKTKNTDRGRVFGDITEIQKEDSRNSTHGDNGTSPSPAMNGESTIDTNVPQNVEGVNSSIRNSSQADSSGYTIPSIRDPGGRQITIPSIRDGESQARQNEIPSIYGPNTVGAAENPFPSEQKVSKFRSNTIENSPMFSEAEKALMSENQFRYNVATEKESLHAAKQRLEMDFDGEVQELPTKQDFNEQDFDTAMGILEAYRREQAETGDPSKMIAWAKMLQEKMTSAGQLVQSAAKYSRTPEGTFLEVFKILDEARKTPKYKVAEEKVGKLRKELSELDTSYKRAKEAYDKAVSEKEALAEELESVKKETARTERNLKKLESLETRIEQAKEKLDAANKRLDSSRQSHSEDVAELKSLEKEIARTGKKTNSKEQKLQSLREKVEQAKEKLDSEVKRYESVKQEYDKAMAEKRELTKNLKSLERKLDRTEQKNEELQNRTLESIQERIKATEAKLQKAQERLGSREALQKRIDDLKDFMAKEVGKGKVSAAQVDEAMKKVASFTETLATLQEGDKKGLIDLIVKQGAARGMKINKHTIAKMQKVDFDFLYDNARNQLLAIAYDVNRSSIGKKLSTYQAISHLLNIPTTAANFVSNVVFGPLETLAKDTFGLVFDTAISAFTGNRALGVSKPWITKNQLKGAMDRARKAAIQIDLDVNSNTTSKYQTTSRRTFKEGRPGVRGKLEYGLSKAEKVLGYALNVTDELRKGSITSKTLDSLQNLVDEGSLSENEALEMATDDALYGTFQDENAVSKILGGLKMFGNAIVGIGDSGQRIGKLKVHDFGLGDICNKYTQALGSIISRIIEYTPMGYLKFFYTLYKANEAGGLKLNPAMQRKAAMNLARPTTSFGLIAAAVGMAAKGILLNQDDEDDKNLKALQGSEGISGIQLNLSALGRWIAGQDTELREGDNLVSLDFLQPINTILAIGTAIANSEDQSFKGKLGASVDAVAKTVIEIPMMQSLKTIVNNFEGDEGFLEKVWNSTIDIAESSISGFVWSPIRQLAQSLDPYYRTADTPLETLQKSIPGLRNLLPATQTPYGEDKQYGNWALNAVNALVLPGDINEYRPHITTRPLTELYNASLEEGKTGLFPDRKAQYAEFENQGEMFKMTEEEQRRYKTLYGNKLQEIQKSILDSKKTDEKKVEELLKAQGEAKEYAQRVIVEARGEMRLKKSQLATFKKYTDAGIREKPAYELYKAIQALEPEIGRKNVIDIQRYRAINNASYLTEKEKLQAVSVISESAYKKASAVAEAGLKFSDIYAIMKKYHDLDGNDSLNASEKTLKFKQWLYSQNYKPNQFRAIRDNYYFINIFPAKTRSSNFKIPSIYN